MRLIMDARTLRPGMTGVGRYTLELLAAWAEKARTGQTVSRLRALIHESNLGVVKDSAPLQGIEWISTSVDYESHPRSDWWERFTLPSLVEPDELFFGPAFLIPTGRQRFRRVAAVHDLGVFKRPMDYSRKFGIYMRWMIRRTAQCAAAIIVPTKAVADDFVRFLPHAHHRIHVVPDAPPSNFDLAWPVDSRITNDPIPFADRPYFASIGTLERRKDPWTALASLQKIWDLRESEELGPAWIWFGGPGQGKLDFLREIRESPVRDHFRCLGPQPRAEVTRTLAQAIALVYPSLDEGFGLPPLEAMAAGIPAVVSDIPPLREVCGDAALYFEPGDARALAKLLRQLMKDSQFRGQYIQRGRAQAAKFSWESTAARTLDILSNLA